MSNEFSVKDYLIEQRLVDEKGNLIVSGIFPRSCDWGMGPYSHDKTLLYLCTLVHFFDYYSMLHNLNIFIEQDEKDTGAYTIDINQIDRREDYAHPNLEWNLVLETLDYLVPLMSGSVVSSLSWRAFSKGNNEAAE